MKYPAWGKIPRLHKDVVITEKLDGTNALISIQPWTGVDSPYHLDVFNDMSISAGSRNRWLTLDDDNFGFAEWVAQHSVELMQLGRGDHYGEWWGHGIQRGYGLKEKRFSLFNTKRWSGDGLTSDCVSVVPVLTIVDASRLNWAVGTALDNLSNNGSQAAPGFTKPEGVVVYHTGAGAYFKVPFEARKSAGVA